jgi:hypothetical protein
MTGPVDSREVEEMSRLLRILNGEQYGEQRSIESHSTDASVSRVAIGESVDPTDDMKAILERFQSGAKASVAKAREDAVDNRPLRDALITEKTKNGVKMGSWEIKVTEHNGVKSYDVTNIHTDEAIAQDLTLYESALCLCKLLNFHVGINSAQVREVLDLEDRYARFRHEAVVFKQRIKQRSSSGDSVRAAIAEDRYQEARTNALNLREQIVAKSKTL